MRAVGADITLFGATGFTGRLIARALAREGLSFRIAGRLDKKLEQLSRELPNQPERLVADATQPNTLPALFKDTRLLINCAGPFTDLGERVIAQAAMSGARYLDITNELGYMVRARGYHQMAQKVGAALIPACGFEVALADCAAHLAGRALMDGNTRQPIDSINILYRLRSKVISRGTRLSAVRSLATSWVAYRDGTWTGQIPGSAIRRIRLPGGMQYGYVFPSSESVTLPLHLPVRRVDAWMATTTLTRLWLPALLPLMARLSRSVLRPLILKIAGRVNPVNENGTVDNLRHDSPFTIYTEARRGNKIHWVCLKGQDPYGLTAEIATYAAKQMISPGWQSNGFLAPSMVFDPAVFLDYAQQHWRITVEQGEYTGK